MFIAKATKNFRMTKKNKIDLIPLHTYESSRVYEWCGAPQGETKYYF